MKENLKRLVTIYNFYDSEMYVILHGANSKTHFQKKEDKHLLASSANEGRYNERLCLFDIAF